ncbi:hypothetical protein [Aliagarivorans marinus]|uniref:hypothetical protein n=1 Tax=Aliagarivorans marinus TaxID=561965 RepID=UPI00047AD2E0|nr:hypothetical protein [Aliagarivorans marinus]
MPSLFKPAPITLLGVVLSSLTILAYATETQYQLVSATPIEEPSTSDIMVNIESDQEYAARQQAIQELVTRFDIDLSRPLRLREVPNDAPRGISTSTVFYPTRSADLEYGVQVAELNERFVRATWSVYQAHQLEPLYGEQANLAADGNDWRLFSLEGEITRSANGDDKRRELLTEFARVILAEEHCLTIKSVAIYSFGHTSATAFCGNGLEISRSMEELEAGVVIDDRLRSTTMSRSALRTLSQ